MNEIAFTKEFYCLALPFFILTIGSMFALMQSVFKKISSTGLVCAAAFVFLTLAWFSSAYFLFHTAKETGFDWSKYLYFEGALKMDHLAALSVFGVLTLSWLTQILFLDSFYKEDFFRGEIVSLYFLINIGMLVLVTTEDMISLFVGLELMSIGLYALIGYIKPDRISIEAAMKYFILGAFATGFMLFGFALLYATVGSLNISDIIATLSHEQLPGMAKAGGLMTLIGIAFKFGLVPFHMWAPDAYEGAPTPITGFMATAVKLVLVVVAIRFFADGMDSLKSVWQPAVIFVAVLSIVCANLLALVQSNLKRMLAYSSIAHSGYMAIGFAAMSGYDSFAVTALLFYVFFYCVLTIGSFAIITWLENDRAYNLTIDELSGLASKQPYAAFCLAVFMLGFAGFPPLAGFISKFFVFSAAVSSGLYVLAIIGVIGSAISLYFYLKILVNMYMRPLIFVEGQLPTIFYRPAKYLAVVSATCLLLSILGGTWLPSTILDSLKLEKSSSIVGE